MPAPALFNSLTVGIWVVDRRGRTLVVNECAARMAGLPIDGIVGRPITGMVDFPSDGWRAGDFAPPRDRRVHRPDGTWMWAEVLARPASEEATPPGSTILTMVSARTPRRGRRAP